MSKQIFNAAVWLLLSCGAAFAQEVADDFSPENAILDTTIPFAIGARQAEQELRGAYGWPTFQEGLVEGVYFRFDPDGYARFSTVPRLDVDVFEVLCRPGTAACLGRKGALAMQLNSSGILHIAIEGVSPGDELFIIDGITELPLPDRVLQPLDTRLETLLSSGGELVVRHGATEVVRVSLSGFLAVSTYLRWIASGQDYAIFPRGWPVPNSQNDSKTGASLTQVVDWESPLRPQQILPDTSSQDDNEQLIAELQLQLLTIQAAMNNTSQVALLPEVADEEPVESLEADSSGELQILSARLNYLMTEIGLDAASALALLQNPNEQAAETNPNEGESDVVDDIITEIRNQIPDIDLEEESSKVPEMESNELELSEQEYKILTSYFKSVFESN